MANLKTIFIVHLMCSSILALPVPTPGGPEASTGGPNAPPDIPSTISGPLDMEFSLYWEETELLFMRACNLADERLEVRLVVDGVASTQEEHIDNSHELSFAWAEQNGGYAMKRFDDLSPEGIVVCEEVVVRVVNSPEVRHRNLMVRLILRGGHPRRDIVDEKGFNISLLAETRPTTAAAAAAATTTAATTTAATTAAATAASTTAQQQQTEGTIVVGGQAGVGSMTAATSTHATSTGAAVPATLATIVAGGVAGVGIVMVGAVLIVVIVALTKCRQAAAKTVSSTDTTTAATPSEAEMRV